jgi:AraC-like DNA-binding protein
MRGAQVDEFQLLWLQGSGQLELVRDQCCGGVLWLPLEGLMHETINGVEHLAEPGTALLFQPGDSMVGRTAEAISGVSIVLPQHYLAGEGPYSPLLRQGVMAQRLIQAAWDLVEVAANQPKGNSFAAERLVDALQQVCHPLSPDLQPERITAKRRRALVADACDWMLDRLADRFSVVELSAAMHVSVRTLQTSFQTELGCSPMAELKRMRLHQLRKFLLNPEFRHQSVAALMNQAGLLACGVTAADYLRWCGELPRRTRRSPQLNAGSAISGFSPPY